MNRLTAEIERLGFEHSRVGLARQLEHRAGIQAVDVDERTSRATITYDDTRLSASDVRHLIAEVGYEMHDSGVFRSPGEDVATSAGAPDE